MKSIGRMLKQRIYAKNMILITSVLYPSINSTIASRGLH